MQSQVEYLVYKNDLLLHALNKNLITRDVFSSEIDMSSRAFSVIRYTKTVRACEQPPFQIWLSHMTPSVRNVPGSERNLTPQPGCSYTDLTDDPVRHRTDDCSSIAKSPSSDVQIAESPTSPDPEPPRSPTPCINIPTTRISEIKQEINTVIIQLPIAVTAHEMQERAESSHVESVMKQHSTEMKPENDSEANPQTSDQDYSSSDLIHVKYESDPQLNQRVEVRLDRLRIRPKLIRSAKKTACTCEGIGCSSYKIKRGYKCIFCSRVYYRKGKLLWKTCTTCCGIICPACQKNRKCAH